jgi:hypothetical protein
MLGYYWARWRRGGLCQGNRALAMRTAAIVHAVGLFEAIVLVGFAVYVVIHLWFQRH